MMSPERHFTECFLFVFKACEHRSVLHGHFSASSCDSGLLSSSLPPSGSYLPGLDSTEFILCHRTHSKGASFSPSTSERRSEFPSRSKDISRFASLADIDIERRNSQIRRIRRGSSFVTSPHQRETDFTGEMFSHEPGNVRFGFSPPRRRSMVSSCEQKSCRSSSDLNFSSRGDTKRDEHEPPLSQLEDASAAGGGGVQVKEPEKRTSDDSEDKSDRTGVVSGLNVGRIRTSDDLHPSRATKSRGMRERNGASRGTERSPGGQAGDADKTTDQSACAYSHPAESESRRGLQQSHTETFCASDSVPAALSYPGANEESSDTDPKLSQPHPVSERKSNELRAPSAESPLKRTPRRILYRGRSYLASLPSAFCSLDPGARHVCPHPEGAVSPLPSVWCPNSADGIASHPEPPPPTRIRERRRFFTWAVRPRWRSEVGTASSSVFLEPSRARDATPGFHREAGATETSGSAVSESQTMKRQRNSDVQ